MTDGGGTPPQRHAPLRRNGEYLRWLCGDLLLDIGTGIGAFAFPLITFMVTDSLGTTGLVALVQGLGAVVGMIPGGLLADRVERRRLRLLAGLSGVAVQLALVVVLLSGAAGAVVLAALAFLDRLRETALGSASAAMLKQIVPTPQLPRAVSVNQGREAAVEMGSGPVGGALLGLSIVFPPARAAAGEPRLRPRDAQHAREVPAPGRGHRAHPGDRRPARGGRLDPHPADPPADARGLLGREPRRERSPLHGAAGPRGPGRVRRSHRTAEHGAGRLDPARRVPRPAPGRHGADGGAGDRAGGAHGRRGGAAALRSGDGVDRAVLHRARDRTARDQCLGAGVLHPHHPGRHAGEGQRPHATRVPRGDDLRPGARRLGPRARRQHAHAAGLLVFAGVLALGTVVGVLGKDLRRLPVASRWERHAREEGLSVPE